MGIFKPNKKAFDSRQRRRLFRALKKTERILAVVIAWMVGAALLYGAYTIIFIKPYFEVEEIKVEGELSYLSTDDVVKASGINIGDHLLRIPVKTTQQKLISSAWIKEAAVHRKFPHMVWIYVKEYIPEAVVYSSGKWQYVDKSGTPFKIILPNDPRDYPIITGLEEFDKEELLPQFKSKVVELLNVRKLFDVSGLGESCGISEIHYSGNRGVSIVTLNDPMELRLGFGPFTEKIERLETLYKAIRSHGGVIAYVDLSPEGKAVVKYGI